VLANIEGKGSGPLLSFAKSKGISDTPLHGESTGGHDEYQLAYIPHKVVIGADGIVVKNYDKVDAEADILALI